MTKTKKSMGIRWLALLLTGALLLPLLAACTNKDGANNDTQRVLRIATTYGYGSEDEYFRQQFTELFEYDNRNITIEIVPLQENNRWYYESQPTDEPFDPIKAMKEMMNGPNPPDLVMLSYEQLPELINDNLLAPLDALMTRDGFNQDDIVPAVLNGLKRLGDNRLYALAPTFSSSALIYNKALFDQVGAPYPTHEMSWDELFALARRVTRGEGENAKYGFSFSTGSYVDLFYEMGVYTAPLQISMIDLPNKRMTVDSDNWENIWRTLVSLHNEKIFPEPPDYSRPRDPNNYSPFEYDNFMSGRLAMAVVHYGYLNQLIEANRNHERIRGFNYIDWDVVTLPTHPSAPGVGGNISLFPVMAINAKAQNADDAWRFIAFSNGDDWARVKSRSSYNLVSRKQYLQPKEGENYQVEAFYQLEPVQTEDLSTLYRTIPNYWMIQDVGRRKFQEVLSGDKAIRDALKEWQTEGDMMLQENTDMEDFFRPGLPMPMPIIEDSISFSTKEEVIILN